MDALAGAPVPGQPPVTGAAAANPLIPGQVVSARVVQALAADTFLLAVRGQTLVAQSPTPLPLDAVVQLAVRSGGTAGEPVSVRLLASGGALAPGESAPAFLSARAIAAQLGLPAGDLGTQLVAACQRQGVPLRPTIVAPLLRLLQEAQGPSAAAEADEAPDAPGSTAAAIASGSARSSASAAVPLSAPASTASAAARAPVPHPGREALAAMPPLPAGEQLPVAGAAGTPAAIPSSTRSPVPIRASGAPAAPAEPAAQGMPGPSRPGPARDPVPHPPAAGPVPATPASEPAPEARPASATAGGEAVARTTPAAVPARGTASIGNPAPPAAPPAATPVRVQGPAIVAAPAAPSSVERSAADAIAIPASGTTASAAAIATISTAGAERVHHTAGDFRRQVLQPQRSWSPGAVRAVAAIPLATQAVAVARLAASPLPVSAALLPLAAIAVGDDLPSPARFLPQRGEPPATPAARTDAAATQPPAPSAAGAIGTHAPLVSAPASTAPSAIPKPAPPSAAAVRQAAPSAAASARPAPDSLPVVASRLPTRPFREAVDLAQGPDPRPAIHQGFALAGLVAGASADGPSSAPPPRERLLTMLLSRLAASPGHGSEPAAAIPAQPLAAASASDAVAAPAPRHQAGLQADEDAPEALAAGAPGTDLGGPAPAAGDDLDAVREQIARDLLPPQELADYDRVLALPLAIAGQPLPARLAVTTRCSAGGLQACWMRLDCDLSRLGPVSVRLGGVEGAPVAITLVARPAAAAELAAALPQLTQDLHQLGVEAALRVVADAEASA